MCDSSVFCQIIWKFILLYAIIKILIKLYWRDFLSSLEMYLMYFFNVLPLSLIVGTVYGIIKYRNDKNTPVSRKILSILFVCYITALIQLVLFLDIVRDMNYWLIHHMDSGRIESYFHFSGSYNFNINFWNHIDGEKIGNIIIFLPFGILYPLCNEKISYKKTLLIGFLMTALIEILQPFIDRSFDLNDIILNTIGVFISATVFFVIKKLILNGKIEYA